MNIDRIGWDVGGAHLKAAALVRGEIVAVAQRPCPLWRGLEHLHAAIEEVLETFAAPANCRHAMTMTGELVDLFAGRPEGVFSLIDALSAHCPTENLAVFAGYLGFLPATSVSEEQIGAVASTNWLATGLYAAARIEAGLLVDLGSTTCDLLILRDGTVHARGLTDHQRLTYDELVYTGVVRTSLMALGQRAPFGGVWVNLMAENFATTADVYRLTGELSVHADQAETADGGAKTREASARRLARLMGCDLESAPPSAWTQLACYFRECQLDRLMAACLCQLSRGLLPDDAPIIGAGVGRFLVQELARRIEHPFLDIVDLFPHSKQPSGFSIADCAPAAAVACLAERQT